MAAVAYYGGSVAGCATGFAAGLLLDLAVGGTMGASSLVLTAVGYGVGRFRELRDPSHGLLPMPVGALATAAWVVAFAAVSFMLDVGRRRQPADLPRHVRDDPAQRAAGAAGLRRLPQAAAARRWSSTRSSCAAAAAPPRETGPLGLRGLEV